MQFCGRRSRIAFSARVALEEAVMNNEDTSIKTK
jgi:hypothetical protein